MKLKQLPVIFILNHIKNFIDPAKIYMTLLVPKIFQSNYFSLSTLARILFTALFCCHLIAKAMILLIVSSLLASLSEIFNQKKLKESFFCITLKVIPLGLSLLYKYCTLTLENILSFSFITVVVVFITLCLFSFLYSEITLCNLYYFCYSNNVFLIIVRQIYNQNLLDNFGEVSFLEVFDQNFIPRAISYVGAIFQPLGLKKWAKGGQNCSFPIK